MNLAKYTFSEFNGGRGELKRKVVRNAKKNISFAVAMAITINALPVTATAEGIDFEYEAPEAVVEETAVSENEAIAEEAVIEDVTERKESYFYGDYEYTLSGSNATIVGYVGTDTEVSIPSKLGTYSVTAIGKSAFRDNATIIKVTIPSGVTSIEVAAFRGCSKLASVSIPATVTSIASGAFLASGLKSVSLPDSLAFLGESAFVDCKSLTSVDFFKTGNVTSSTVLDWGTYNSLGHQTFVGCESLTTVSLPDHVTKIPGRMFAGCASLKSFKIPASVTDIEFAAFRDCGALASVTFNDKLTSIASSAFAASGINKLLLPEGITFIGSNAFNGCASLTTVSFYDAGNETDGIVLDWGTYNSLGHQTFVGCTALTSVSLPDYVTKIPGRMFAGCTSLKSFKIPASVTDIEFAAFRDCGALASVTFNDKLTSIASGAFAASGINKLLLPEGITFIGSNAFSDCTSLTTVAFYDAGNETDGIDLDWGSYNSLGHQGFMNCTSLATVTLPDYATNIPERIFAGCTALKATMLPKSLNNISAKAFIGCSEYTRTYYKGTSAEWLNVTIEAGGNETLAKSTKYYNAESLLNFVERMYTKLLGRSSDFAGKQSHVDNLMIGTPAAKVVANFALSAELQKQKIDNRTFVRRMYQTMLNRTPSSDEITNWASYLDSGCTYSFVLKGFVTAPEFSKLCANYGVEVGTYNATENRDKNGKLTKFISRLYTKALNRAYDA
ncbi:MAG: leucine-rich repeat protein, partial [Ruminiclostridium sp.]|nr:leucine-rich repeat protein [Ruminiclostridium sp.]